MTTIRDPARLTAVRTAMKELAEVDKKTAKYMERGRGPLGLFGASCNSFFTDDGNRPSPGVLTAIEVG